MKCSKKVLGLRLGVLPHDGTVWSGNCQAAYYYQGTSSSATCTTVRLIYTPLTARRQACEHAANGPLFA